MSAYPARTMAELAYTFESAARPGQHIDEIATPALLVDPDRMERNIAHFQALADANAIKSASAHQDAHGAGDRADADRRPRRRHHVRQDRRDRGLRRRGFDDIVVAYPVFGEYKWRRLAERPGARGGVAHHDLEEVKQVADTAQSTAGSRLVGLTTDRQIFFAGASGSIVHKGAARTPGITELRAVPYVFCDLMELGFGVCGWDDLAVSILCTVVSTRQPGGATIDDGSKTFSGDRGLVGIPVADLDALAVAAGRDMSRGPRHRGARDRRRRCGREGDARGEDPLLSHPRLHDGQPVRPPDRLPRRARRGRLARDGPRQAHLMTRDETS
jgi:hypothetical protein